MLEIAQMILIGCLSMLCIMAIILVIFIIVFFIKYFKNF